MRKYIDLAENKELVDEGTDWWKRIMTGAVAGATIAGAAGLAHDYEDHKHHRAPAAHEDEALWGDTTPSAMHPGDEDLNEGSDWFKNALLGAAAGVSLLGAAGRAGEPRDTAPVAYDQPMDYDSGDEAPASAPATPDRPPVNEEESEGMLLNDDDEECSIAESYRSFVQSEQFMGETLFGEVKKKSRGGR